MTDVTELRNWLIDNVSYNEETGICYWLTSKWNASRTQGHYVGDVVGRIDNNGYCVITFNLTGKPKKYLVHRLIWLIQTGDWPIECIDHINNIRTDNRWCNLREASKGENCRNRSHMTNNTTGHIGICIHYTTKKGHYYRAEIATNGVLEHIYSYSLEECIEWRRLKVKEQHKEFGYLPIVD